MENIIAYILAYLIGALPFGLIFGKIYGAGDIRQSGSGSIGATNVLRVLKEKNPQVAKKVAIFTFFGDFLKAVIPICVARFLGFDDRVLWTMAVLSVFGHCFSPYLKFNGGKGIATGVGAIMAMLPLEAVLGLVAWRVVGKLFKISSVASLAGTLTAIGLSFVIHPNLSINTHAPLLIIGFVIVYKHLGNIGRLLSGKEAKI